VNASETRLADTVRLRCGVHPTIEIGDVMIASSKCRIVPPT
jgi:hypothetical protein